MQLEFLFHPNRQHPPAAALGAQSSADPSLLRPSTRNPQPLSTSIHLSFVRHRRARRYILRLLPDGTARVTVPRWGTLREAAAFARANSAWLQQRLAEQASRPKPERRWLPGMPIFFRGKQLPIELTGNEIRFGDEVFSFRRSAAIGCPPADLRPLIETHLRRVAAAELPARVDELARANGFIVRRVSVRNQHSRWGSCSRRGTVSLNWRLVQVPEFVRDYIILHELAHMKHMNHSRRFWAEVERFCPGYSAAERWLKQHAKVLLP